MRKNYLVIGLSILFMVAIMPLAAAQDTTEAPKEMETAQETTEAPKEMETVAVLNVETIACGTAVEERELQGQDTTFAKGIEKVYCWSLITGCEDPTAVEHVWYLGGEEKARVTLDVKYPRVRTWSSKTILPKWTGDWKVEVVDSSGKVIGATSFIIE